MRYILILVLFVCFSCKNEAKKEDTTTKVEVEEITYKPFGKKIIADDAIAAASMAKHYETMKAGDTIDSKISGKITEVCSKKGCWMTLDLENGKEVMVRFKDYGFFMPLNSAGSEVIVNGKAFVNETPVSELRHYAEDAGKSKEEIEAITEPKKTYSFVADGVLLAE